MKDSFRPEFLNRIDEIVLFSQLKKEDIKQIAERLLDKTKLLLKDHEVTISVTDGAMDYLVDHGFNEEYGARPLRRLIQKELENVLSSKIISGEVTKGDAVEVTGSDAGLKIKVKALAKVRS